jgi:8-oxo-dGTP diphosphatase
MTDSKPAISAAIIVQEGRVLMVRRRVKEGELMWQFPAGGIEDGETPEDAAVRETLEEAGLEVKALRELGNRVHPKTGALMHYVACEVVSGEAIVADPEELDAVEWLRHDEIPAHVPYGLFDAVQAYLDVELVSA